MFLTADPYNTQFFLKEFTDMYWTMSFTLPINNTFTFITQKETNKIYEERMSNALKTIALQKQAEAQKAQAPPQAPPQALPQQPPLFTEEMAGNTNQAEGGGWGRNRRMRKKKEREKASIFFNESGFMIL